MKYYVDDSYFLVYHIRMYLIRTLSALRVLVVCACVNIMLRVEKNFPSGTENNFSMWFNRNWCIRVISWLFNGHYCYKNCLIIINCNILYIPSVSLKKKKNFLKYLCYLETCELVAVRIVHRWIIVPCL